MMNIKDILVKGETQCRYTGEYNKIERFIAGPFQKFDSEEGGQKFHDLFRQSHGKSVEEKIIQPIAVLVDSKRFEDQYVQGVKQKRKESAQQKYQHDMWCILSLKEVYLSQVVDPDERNSKRKN